jgi:hypothetical protein
MIRNEPLSLLEYRWKHRSIMLPKHRRNEILKLLQVKYMEIQSSEIVKTLTVKSNI